MLRPHYLQSIATLLAVGISPLVAATDNVPMDVIVVSGSRVEHASFDLPAAIDVVDHARIGAGQMRVNASEALTAVPGLVILNRQNYAQDLQISSRGFGARSAFGVRGIRLISDGIPATMPDGQGQAATFNLDMAERIEVLRGPLAAIYGNHSGGVIQLMTKEGQGAPSVETSIVAGSDDVTKIDINAQGKSGAIGYVVDSSRFQTDGYRTHSAATRDEDFVKITLAPWSKSKLTFIATKLYQADTQDPLGVQWLTFQNNPRAAEIDSSDTQIPKRSFAERYNTRKSIDHEQLGATYEQHLGEDRLRLTLYGGNRQVIQYQAFSKAFQTPISHSGGVIDFDRNFYGADLNWVNLRTLARGTMTTTVGLDYARSSDARQGFENFIGTQFGVKGKLRRDEQDLVVSLDPYLQTEWQAGAWLLSAGLRHSKMEVEVRDHFLSNGNDSGSRNYSHTTPFLAVLYKVSPTLNLYTSAAHGFESPTLNELFYSGSGGGFNFNLQSAQSTHVEAGAKARIGADTQINAALFEVRTKDELVVDSSSGGRTSYRNASKTLRQGIELAFNQSWCNGISTHLAATALRAVYDQAFGNIPTGRRLPGVPGTNLYGELAWQDSAEHFNAAIEAIVSSKLYPEDSNKETPAPGYAIANIRVGAKQNWSSWRFKQFVRVNNLLDRTYVGSVIVGDSNKRYYEAALGRNWLLGASAQYVF